MSLSNKIMFQMGDEELDEKNMVYHADDVKEFIKQLKEKICEWHPESFSLSNVLEDIDDLAGDALVLEGDA